MIYLIGSLRNPEVPIVADKLRIGGFDVFDEWFAAGERADDAWRDHFKQQGLTFIEALNTRFVRHAFEFDRKHLLEAEAVVLVAPAGKSAHLELGWALGLGKPGFILLDSPDRWDLMYRFATKVVMDVPQLITALEQL